MPAILAMAYGSLVGSRLPVSRDSSFIGWGASLGAMAGATYGAKNGSQKEGWLSDLVKDAITNGQVVLVAQTNTEQETEIAREAIQTSVGNHKDINSA